MGFPTFIYLTANIDEQCARFPQIGHFTIALLNGFYNVSSGIFLIVNKLHETGLLKFYLTLMGIFDKLMFSEFLN